MSNQHLTLDGHCVWTCDGLLRDGFLLHPVPSTYGCRRGNTIAYQGQETPNWNVCEWDGAVTIISGPSSFVRGGHEALVWQDPTGAGCWIQWQRGQPPVCIADMRYPMDADDDDRIVLADAEKKRVTVRSASALLQTFTLIYGLTTDDWDGPGVPIVGDYVAIRDGPTYDLTRVSDGAPVPGYVVNPRADYLVPVLLNGRLACFERGDGRLVLRFFDTAQGWELIPQGGGDQFGCTIEQRGTDLRFCYWGGQNYSGWSGMQTRDVATLLASPTIDVTVAPPLPPLPMPVAPMGHKTSVGWYFATHRADSQGGPFPDLDPHLPCDFIYPTSELEFADAMTRKIPVIVMDEAHANIAGPLGLIWAFGARNEDGLPLQPKIDALLALSIRWDRPIQVYNDSTFDQWPATWPKHAVASIRVYYSPYENQAAWVDRLRGTVLQFVNQFPGVAYEICVSAFDRNLTGWIQNQLGNLQVTFFDYVRGDSDCLGWSCFDWGRGRGIPGDPETIGGAYQHPEIRDRWLALAPAISGPSRWPRPSDFPPTPPEDEMTYDDWAALMVGTPAAIQPTVALDLTKTTQAQLTNQWVNHRIVDMTAQAVGRAPTVAEGAQCLMLIQAGYSDPQIKLKVWNVVQP